MPGEFAVLVPPPRPVPDGAVSLDRLWGLLTEAQRQQTLVVLSSIVVRQVDAPLDDREVRDDRS